MIQAQISLSHDPPIAPSTVSTTFTLHCELETKNNVIKDGDWTFIGSNGNPNIVKIPFEEGIHHPFFDKDNLREERWKKYVLPTIQAFAGPVAAATITGGATMAAAVMGTPASSTATIYNVNSNVTRNVWKCNFTVNKLRFEIKGQN